MAKNKPKKKKPSRNKYKNHIKRKIAKHGPPPEYEYDE